jgi:hypothetical protein
MAAKTAILQLIKVDEKERSTLLGEIESSSALKTE